VSRAVLLTLLSRAVQLLSGFAGTVITARFLGPDARGEYFFVVTVALVVVQFANLGLQSSNTYYAAQDASLLGALVANSAWVSVVLGGGGAALAVALLRASGWSTTARPSLMWFAAALAPAVLFFMLGTNLLVGIQRIGAFNAIEAASNVGVALALVGAGLASFGVRGFLAVSAASWSLASATLLVYLLRQDRASLRFRGAVFRGGLRYALKAYLVTALGFLVLRGNVFMLQRSYGPRELGFYSVAAQVADAITIFPSSVALVLFPRLVQDARRRWQSTVRSAAVVGAALAAVCAAVAAVSSPFMRLTFGADFTPAARVLLLLLPGVLALGVASVLSQFLASIGVPRLLVGIWLVTLGIVLGVGRLLIPGHAGAGAAAALSIGYGALLLMVGALAYRRRTAEAAATPIPVAAAPESEGVIA
jgi:antigen flippase